MRNIKLSTLRSLYNTLEKTKIPSFSGVDDLDDWIEYLIEIDAVLAGLACSLLGSEKLLKKEIPVINNLKNSFSNIIKNKKLQYPTIQLMEKV